MSTGSFQNFHDIEKSFMGRLRSRIKTTENHDDLRHFFSTAVSDLLNSAYEGAVPILETDIVFEPSNEEHYELSRRLRGSARFMDTWNNSNLPGVIRKAADTTYHRYLHMNKHHEKTERKIRN